MKGIEVKNGGRWLCGAITIIFNARTDLGEEMRGNRFGDSKIP